MLLANRYFVKLVFLSQLSIMRTKISFIKHTFQYIYHVQKTKPTQHSVRGLRGLGLTPHILACRSTTVCHYLFLCSTESHRQDTSFITLVWGCKYVLALQALDESVKGKLAQFCHVPVCGQDWCTCYACISIKYLWFFELYFFSWLLICLNNLFPERKYLHALWCS